MKKLHILMAVLSVQTLCAQASIDELMQHCRKQFLVPGLSVGIVHKGEICHLMGYGLRDQALNLPMTEHTICPIGSPTKSFTAYLIGQMVDEGLLHWDDRVIDHLPQFQLSDPLLTQKITIRDLLQHTTNLPSHDGAWYRATIDRHELLKRLCHLPLTNPLEKRFIYQNLNYLIAGLLLEEVTQRSWEELMYQQLLYPLGMYNTSCTFLDFNTHADRAQGYRKQRNRIVPCSPIDGHLIAPACALNSSAWDLTRWIQHLLGDHQPLLNPSTWKEMTQSGTPSNFFQNLSLGQLSPPWEEYGLGWMLLPYRNEKLVAHVGRMDGFTSLITLIPDKDLGIVVLCNKEHSFCPIFATTILIDQMLHLPPLDFSSLVAQAAVIDGNFPIPFPPRKKLETTPSHALPDYCGIYEHPGYGIIAIVPGDDGRLHWQFRSAQAPLEHWHYDVFLLTTDDIHPLLRNTTFEFFANVHGDITSVSVALDPHSEKILFKKCQEETEDEVFTKFIGTYHVFGYSISVFEEMGHLMADIPGLTKVELTKKDKNTFSIKNYRDYHVEFVEDETLEVTGFQVYKSAEMIGSGSKT